MIKYITRIFLLTSIIFFFTAEFIFPQSGVIRSYYSKKKIESEVSYIDDVLDGTSIWYYENGNIKEQKTYNNGKLNGWARSFYESGLLKEEFFLNNGVLDGIASCYYDNGALKEIKYYTDGELTKVQSLDYDSIYVARPEDFKGTTKRIENGYNPYEFLCDVDICAEPLGGMEALQKKIVYPQYAKLYGLEGFVILIAEVNQVGVVTKTSIIKKLGLGCDEEAQRVVKETKFIPGQDKSGVTASSVTLHIEFKVEDDSTSLSTETPDSNKIEFNSDLVSDINKKGPCGFDACPEPVGGIEAILRNYYLLPDSVRSKIELTGRVVIDTEVDQFGNVVKTHVIEGINKTYNIAAETALKQTRFYPAVENGVRVPAAIKITIPFED